MIFLPFDSFQIKSSLSSDQVKEVLRKALAAGAKRLVVMNPFKTPKNPFRGEVFENDFKMTRNINYRNSAMPVIKGTIIDSYPGTIIEMKMRVMVVVYVFMFLWVVGLSLVALGMLQQEDKQQVLIPAGMLVAGYAAIMIGYKYEVYKSRKILTRLLGGESL